MLTAISSPALATNYVDGQFTSWSQNSWGAKPLSGPPANLLLVKDGNGLANYDNVYVSGMQIGSSTGFHTHFARDETSSSICLSGAPAAFNSNINNPGARREGRQLPSAGVRLETVSHAHSHQDG